MAPVSRSDRGGQVYLDLQRQARKAGRGTQEYLVRYALERFLYRLANTRWRDRLVLKGGMLLTVYDVRRTTQDLDIAARSLDNDTGEVISWLTEIFAEEVDDGILFESATVRAETIREADPYPGVRLHAQARLATARISLKLDVNFGDPIVPCPSLMTYPSLLGDAFEVLAYPLASVLSEKIETMVRRGDANTRERDFFDVWSLIRGQTVDASEFRAALEATASFRGTELVPLSHALTDYGRLRQKAWSDFIARMGLTGAVPERLVEVVDDVASFADPVLSGHVVIATWNPVPGLWESN